MGENSQSSDSDRFEYLRVMACILVVWGFCTLIFCMAIRSASVRSSLEWVYGPGPGSKLRGIDLGYYAVLIYAAFALLMGVFANRSHNLGVGRFLLVSGILLFVSFMAVHWLVGPPSDYGWH